MGHHERRHSHERRARLEDLCDHRSGDGTIRAAFGGALASRELWFGETWYSARLPFTLGFGDACQWPYSLWCFLPEVELGPRGFDLVIGDLPGRVFPAWY